MVYTITNHVITGFLSYFMAIDTLLVHDLLSTQFVFRVVMISIFAASDLWNHGDERSMIIFLFLFFMIVLI